MKALLLAVLVDALSSALEDRERTFNSVGVDDGGYQSGRWVNGDKVTQVLLGVTSSGEVSLFTR